ncbi:MAG TPA: RsmG family class I SAM-dependent methyltransferase, partial [Gammaproteobacteria bacterium]|nr:RsmG family class I SAM-dependent methyltransferase [Gammaproteobacteria bacterium]
VHSRVEDYRPESPFDVVIARAYAALAVLLEQVRPLLAAGGTVLAMKGLFPEEELAAVPAGFRVAEVVPLAVPGLDAERHLVRVVRDDAAAGY